jgi:hypothetical protein
MCIIILLSFRTYNNKLFNIEVAQEVSIIFRLKKIDVVEF